MTRKLFWMIFVAPVLGATALSAGAEQAEDSLFRHAENALQDEARVLHRDFTSPERWRDWTLERANGEEADIQAWMSSRWKETPGRLADSLAGSAASWVGAGLRESEWVETLDFGFQLPLEGRTGWMNLNAIGPLSRGEDSVLGWQLPLSFGSADDDGETEMVGNVGLFYRRTLGDWGLAGVNLFGDYQDEGANGDFWRWSVGAEYRTSWADVFVNRYIPSSPAQRTLLSGGTQERIAYSAGGYDAEVRFHAPRSRWLEGFAEYSLWEGEYGDADDSGFRYGFRLLPRTGGLADGFRFEADYDDTLDGGLGARFSYDWTLGQTPRRTGYAVFDPRAHLFSPVERRHEQEIRVRIRTLGINGAVARSESESDCSPSDSVITAAQQSAANISLTMHVIAGDYDGVCGSLRGGASPNHPDGDEESWALHFAATLTVSDAVKIASVLVSAGASVDAKGGGSGDTPLHMAASVDAGPMANFLIAAGADKEVTNNNHARPLHIAAIFGATAVIKAMLDREENPAEVNARIIVDIPYVGRWELHTPLDLAISNTVTVRQERAAVYLLAYNGECRTASGHDWCDAEGLSLPVSPFSGGGTLAAAGYDGVVGSFSEVTSEVGKITLKHSLIEGGDDFTNEDREVRAKNPLEEGERAAVMQVAASKGRLSTVFLTATFSVTVESGNDYTVTLSPYSRGAALTLESERFSELEFEKSDGNVELTLSQNGVVSATVNLRLEDAYTLKAEATVAGMLGTLRFSAEVYPSCESGALFSPLVSSGSFYGEILGNDLQRICWLISQGRDLNRSVFLGQGPLHLAAVFGRAEIASLLLFYGAEVNKLNVVGETPLDAGVSGGGVAALPVLVNNGGVCMQEENQDSSECGLRLWPRDVSVTAVAGYRGSLYALGAVPPEGGEVEYFLGTDAPRNIVLENGVVRRYAPLSGGDAEHVTVGVRSGAQTLFAGVKISAMAEVSEATATIPADHSGAVHTLALPGFDNATYAKALGSAGEFTVAVNGEVSLKDGESLAALGEYVVVARAEDAGFLGEAMLTLRISALRGSRLTLSYPSRQAMAGGYSGVVLTISAGVDEGATVSYAGGLVAPFTLAASGSNFILSLTAALSGPDALMVKPDFVSRKAGFSPKTESAIIRVTVLSSYSDSVVIQRNETGVFYQFSIPGHGDATFNEVGSSPDFSVEPDGEVSRVAGAVLATQSVHNIVVSATDDGFLGESILLTLDVSVSFCSPEVTLSSEGATQVELDQGLYEAAKSGDVESACEWVQKGADPGKADERIAGGTFMEPSALHAAASEGHLEMVKFLMSYPDVDVDASIFLNMTPLFVAAEGGHLEVVKYLASQGADVNVSAYWGIPPLYWAMGYEHWETVKYLVSNGGDMNAKYYRGQSPLHWATSFGNLTIVMLMVSHGADVNVRKDDYTTPLHNAASNGDLEVVRFLVSHGANVNAQKRDASYSLIKKDAPIHSAAHYGHLDIVKYLVSQGAEVDIKARYDKTPLHEAAWRGHVDVVEYLVSRGADTTARGGTWPRYTPLHYAAAYGHLDVAEYLLDIGVDVNIHIPWRGTPLDQAVKKAHDWWYSDSEDRSRARVVASTLIARGGICLERTYAMCGLIMRPSGFTVTVTAGYSGAVHTVTAMTRNSGMSPVYSIEYGGRDFQVNAETGVLSPVGESLAEEGAVTVSVKAMAAGGTQSVTVEVVVEVTSSSSSAALSAPPALISRGLNAESRVALSGGASAGFYLLRRDSWPYQFSNAALLRTSGGISRLNTG